MDYKQKLIEWNNTEKYKSEVDFLYQLVCPVIDIISTLDYGAGTCRTAMLFNADAYDINDYKEDYPNVELYLNELPNKFYNDIYFMHSFAHIPNPSDVLRILRSKYEYATFTVITPNAEWLDEGYVGDETVIKHYTQKELKELFESCGYKVTLLGQFGEYKNGHNERIFLQAHV